MNNLSTEEHKSINENKITTLAFILDIKFCTIIGLKLRIKYHNGTGHSRFYFIHLRIRLVQNTHSHMHPFFIRCEILSINLYLQCGLSFRASHPHLFIYIK